MRMPDKKNPNTNSSPRGYKRNPLVEPFGKILHSIHVRSIYLLKIGFVLMRGFVGNPK
jgi:hypothetical protein